MRDLVCPMGMSTACRSSAPVDNGAQLATPGALGRTPTEHVVAVDRGSSHTNQAVWEEAWKAASSETVLIAPSLKVLHESPGENADSFLSFEYGLCNPRPIRPLPYSHQIWEDAAAKLADCHDTGCYEPLARLPIIDASSHSLPDAALKRAAMLLGVMAHSWGHLGPGGALPLGVFYPWTEVNRRMGRPGPTMTYADYFTLNLTWRPGTEQASTEGVFTDQNVYTETDVSVKAFGTANELHFVRYNFGMDFFSRQLPALCAQTQQAVLMNDAKRVATLLRSIIQQIHALTEAFSEINPQPLSSEFCCPVVWSKTIGCLIPPIREGELSLSGLQNSTIHLVDCFLGRSQYHTVLGRLAQDERAGWLPSLHLAFISALSEVSIRDFVLQQRSGLLSSLYNQLLDAWCGPGESSFLSKHRLKMDNFLELGMKTSRTASSGGTAGGGDWGDSRSWEQAALHLHYCAMLP